MSTEPSSREPYGLMRFSSGWSTRSSRSANTWTGSGTTSISVTRCRDSLRTTWTSTPTAGHPQDVQSRVQLLLGQLRRHVAALQHDLADGLSLLQRLLGDRRRLLVAQVAVQRRDDRRRRLGVLAHLRDLGLGAGQDLVRQ